MGPQGAGACLPPERECLSWRHEGTPLIATETTNCPNLFPIPFNSFWTSNSPNVCRPALLCVKRLWVMFWAGNWGHDGKAGGEQTCSNLLPLQWLPLPAHLPFYVPTQPLSRQSGTTGKGFSGILSQSKCLQQKIHMVHLCNQKLNVRAGPKQSCQKRWVTNLERETFPSIDLLPTMTQLPVQFLKICMLLIFLSKLLYYMVQRGKRTWHQESWVQVLTLE